LILALVKCVQLDVVLESECEVIGIIILHILRNPKHNRASTPVSTTIILLLNVDTYLNITIAFATTFAIPSHSVMKLAPSPSLSSLTKYFNTITVTLPASPPAISANPKNNTNLAFHATPEPE